MVQTNYGEITDNPADAGRVIGKAEHVFGLAAGGGAKKVSTIVVDTAANLTEYVYSCGGGTVTFTSDASGTKIEIAAGLAAAHNALAASGSVAFAVSDGVDTVTITGREAGDDFAISESDGNLTLAAVTAASSGSAIPFGIGVVRSSFSGTGGECGLPSLGTAKVMTATPTAVNLAEYTITVTIDADGDGIPEVYVATYTGDASATLTEISAGLTLSGNGVMPANTVLFTDADPLITLTAEIPGTEFEAVGAATLGAVNPVTLTTATARDMFAGLALKTQRVETTTANAAGYAADDTVDVMALGEGWVRLDSGEAPVVGGAVFLRASATGTEQLGAFRTDTDGGDAYLLPNCYWTRSAETALDGVTDIAGLMVRV